MTAGFRIDGREYEMSSIRRVTLRDTLTFNAEARRADLGITWAGLLALVDEVTARRRMPRAPRCPVRLPRGASGGAHGRPVRAGASR